MRFKTLTLFLVIQLLSFAIWQAMPTKTHVSANEPVQLEVQTHAAAETNVNPDFSTRNLKAEQAGLNSIREEQIKTVLENLPSGHAQSVKNIILDYSPSAYRGLGGNNLIILRAVGIEFKEFVSVLIHETGHNVDYGYLTHEKTEEKSDFMDGKQPVYITDPSLNFYSISWEDENTLKKSATNLDFVSGYAMTDPFEDFAETYTYYILHGNDFRALTSTSPYLYAKYRFMRYRVFNGREFNTDDGEVHENQRPWDTTVLSYDLDDFFTS